MQGLDDLLARIAKECPLVTRIIPGRIAAKRAHNATRLSVQYATPTGLKCLYVTRGSVQEIFLVSSQPDQMQAWLVEVGMVEKSKLKRGSDE